MKLPNLLLFAASAVLAHSSDSDVHNHESLRGSSGSDEVCLSNPADLKGVFGVLASHHVLSGSSQTWDASGPNSTQGTGARPSGHVWTYSEPCFRAREVDICVFTDTTFADGRGVSLVTTRKRAEYLARSSAFTHPEVLKVKGLNEDLNGKGRAKYEMRDIPGKGKGLVATEFIKRGDPIMANTISVMVDYRAFRELPPEQFMQLEAYAIDRLPEHHRAAFMRLTTQNAANISTHAQKVDKIITTNSFDIIPDKDDDDQPHTLLSAFVEIARLNHDCRPNSEYHFSHNTKTHHIHAIRDISPGEELTLTYIYTVLSRDVRAKRLKNWGFQCSCPLCTREQARADASDARIAQIKAITKELRNYTGSSRASPQMAELLVRLYELEELWGALYQAHAYAALEYNGVGDPWTAAKYARNSVEYGIPSVGEDDTDMKEMRELADRPMDHWSWMLRTRKKNVWSVGEHDEE